jgi:hypothetical protein
MNDQITIDGMNFARPTDRAHAERIAARWEQGAANWEEGEPERIQCEKIAAAFREIAKKLA